MFDFFNSDNNDWSLINSLLIVCSEPISGDCESDVNSLYDFESDVDDESNIDTSESYL